MGVTARQLEPLESGTVETSTVNMAGIDEGYAAQAALHYGFQMRAEGFRDRRGGLAGAGGSGMTLRWSRQDGSKSRLWKMETRPETDLEEEGALTAPLGAGDWSCRDSTWKKEERFPE